MRMKRKKVGRTLFTRKVYIQPLVYLHLESSQSHIVYIIYIKFGILQYRKKTRDSYQGKCLTLQLFLPVCFRMLFSAVCLCIYMIIFVWMKPIKQFNESGLNCFESAKRKGLFHCTIGPSKCALCFQTSNL